MTTDETVVRPTLAWLGNAAVKAGAVARMRAHREADTFVQGLYAELDPDAARQYRGCFHGCLTTEAVAAERGVTLAEAVAELSGSSSRHYVAAERLFGFPLTMSRLLDVIFESVPAEDAGVFALAATEAVPVGADLSLVVARLMLDLLVDGERGVLRHTKPGSAQHEVVRAVAALYRRKLAGEQVPADEWRSVRAAPGQAGTSDAAYAAEAARDAAYAAYADAAEFAAYADAAEFAAYAADSAAGADADGQPEYYRWLGDRLVHHLSTAPVPAAPGP